MRLFCDFYSWPFLAVLAPTHPLRNAKEEEVCVCVYWYVHIHTCTDRYCVVQTDNGDELVSPSTLCGYFFWWINIVTFPVLKENGDHEGKTPGILSAGGIHNFALDFYQFV